MPRSIRNAFLPGVSTSKDHPWRGLSSQFLLITLAALLYFAVRMFTSEAEDAAFANAEKLIHFERAFGLDLELAAQGLVLGNDALVTMWNWVYIWFHWPVIITSLFLLYRYSRRNFLLFRNALILSGAIGLVIFALFPVAPPRFIAGFEDTVTNLSTSYKFLQPPSIINEFAALPSFHVGWNLLAGLIVFRSTHIRLIRLIAVLSPSLMALAVVFTANHWIIDAVVGSAVALLGYAGARWINSRTISADASEPAGSGQLASLN